MHPLKRLKSEILVQGEDLWLSDDDFARIRACVPQGAPIPLEDLHLLAEIRAEARAVCQEFDEWFFPALREQLLADGQISPMEQLTLLRILYGGGGIDDAERRFLQDLRRELARPSPEFEALYQDVMRE